MKYYTHLTNVIIKFTICLIFPIGSYKAQNVIDHQIKITARQFSADKNFCRAAGFFLDKVDDSALIYAGRQLDEGQTDPVVKDFCNYFRGVAFKEKKMFKESKSSFESINPNFILKLKVDAFLGDISLEQGDFVNAIIYFQSVVECNRYDRYGINEDHIIHNLGLCYLHLGLYDKAQYYLFASLKLQEERKDTNAIIISYMDIAGMYYEQYKDDLALNYYRKAYQLSKRSDNFLIRKNAAINMAVVQENNRNYKASLEYRKESEVWSDSLNDQSRIWSVAQMEKQFAIKSKQSEVDNLTIVNKLRTLEKNRILYVTVTLLIILIGGFYFYYQNLKKGRVIMEQKEMLSQSNKTKDMLFSIVSHDLRSYLNSLHYGHRKMLNDYENQKLEMLHGQLLKSSAIVSSTQNLLNNLLHWALVQTQQLYFHQEIINVNSLVRQVVYNYQPLLDEKNISFENKISVKAFVYADQESLKIIVRNLLDNAIKYSDPGGFIKLYDEILLEKYHSIIIEDKGKGMSAEQKSEILNKNDSDLTNKSTQERSTGLGLQLCQIMTEKNKGILRIESEQHKGTKIIISLLKANYVQS
ncbi:tetratricopeptide repeat-containing sensor histidine kinase [Chryseobacterium sp. FH1]|uniref:tetratricopeptide repeat-containing sensor histidine kinase n=1 Tax=Chryseobacterium sp. FH1 TaxID=1233951 RepID=UPI0004E3EC3B|nr:tetratricopeptide repeat-containing sensor histidine kinase [Chryseobacterium sp. FH1]KFC19661.1 hypothetical protein IO90_10330 [Chryseobacterium sp. FH1]